MSGDTPAQGSVMKLVGNFFISSIIEIFSEGMALGERNGLRGTGWSAPTWCSWRISCSLARYPQVGLGVRSRV